MNSLSGGSSPIEEAIRYVFYDVGVGSTTISLVAFSEPRIIPRVSNRLRLI
ncbi:MAG: hypothetical protein RMI79_07330 [Nitrososphaerota archaeon]|nr:hypothetical protein [Nitrososphaerota archaeon]